MAGTTYTTVSERQYFGDLAHLHQMDHDRVCPGRTAWSYTEPRKEQDGRTSWKVTCPVCGEYGVEVSAKRLGDLRRLVKWVVPAHLKELP